MLEYAPNGLIGVLTPQANTTVEPEFWLMLPPGHALINARLTSAGAGIEARLLDYLERLPEALGQFANAPVGAIAFACTGASYLAGASAEDALAARIEQARGVPLVTAGKAVCDALDALGARRIGLVSPYPAGLTEAAVGYWQSRGLEVGTVAGAFNAGSDFHPIYSLRATSAADALAPLETSDVDAIVMLGTGMPTLGPIAAVAGWSGPPVLSCMLALGWRSVEALHGRAPDAASLRQWIGGEGWASRLRAHLPG